MESFKKIEVRFYCSPSGNEPVREWLMELTPGERKIIGKDIKTVEFGWPVGLPVCRSLGDGLWEVRSSLKNRIARILFCITGEHMWLLHGFIKKQQKTPASELEIARKRQTEIQKDLRFLRKGK
ncbi:MAG: type II toxin-antitoxin system RelE/ParE family toxin [Mesotoga sp.]|nr:type II toxin-antitoxin system RelE/ParE family toxin [Mesotoga sp.]